VVAGTSRYDQSWLARTRELLDRRDDDFAVTYLTDLPIGELTEAVRALPPDSVVLYLTMTADPSGSRFVSRDVAQRISDVSPVPVFGFLESYIGYGVVASHAPSFVNHGRAAGALMLRVLKGEPGAAERIEAGPGPRCVADARELDRRGLNEAALPAGCEVLSARRRSGNSFTGRSSARWRWSRCRPD